MMTEAPSHKGGPTSSSCAVCVSSDAPRPVRETMKRRPAVVFGVGAAAAAPGLVLAAGGLGSRGAIRRNRPIENARRNAPAHMGGERFSPVGTSGGLPASSGGLPCNGLPT